MKWIRQEDVLCLKTFVQAHYLCGIVVYNVIFLLHDAPLLGDFLL